jgi:glycosyltransferase involved in cell wall biosynthesis
LVGTLLKKPLIVTIHGSDLRMALESHGFLRKIFIYVCKNATHINCVSEVQRKEIEQLNIRNKKMSTIPMGVDEAFFEAGRSRGEKLNGRRHTILSNRNLLPIYNVSLLIRSIPIVLKEETNVRFLIAGEGAEKENLEKEVNQLGVTSFVQFLGRVPHGKMANLLAQADVYVSTSLYDGTSVSLLEAMGAGALPIVTDIPANREWITNGQN